MEDFQQKLIIAALSFGLSSISTLIAAKARPRARILVAQAHQFSFDLKGNDGIFIVNTRTILIQNSGRDIAKNIEVCFTAEPANYKIWPPCEYTTTENKENFFFIKIEKMTAKSHLVIEMLQSVSDLPNLISVNHEGGAAKPIEVQPQQIYSKQTQYFLAFLVILGGSSIFFIIIMLALYIWGQ